jgi:uncharacterized protein YcnI
MTRQPLFLAPILLAFAVTSASAHIMVSPPRSKAGATQKYEMRVHNEGKVATTSVELDIPDGITVLEVADPSTGTFTTSKTGDRITSITWKVAVQPGKYVALPFTAKNPSGATSVQWNVREQLSDGSQVDWSSRPGAEEKASSTLIVAATS